MCVPSWLEADLHLDDDGSASGHNSEQAAAQVQTLNFKPFDTSTGQILYSL